MSRARRRSEGGYVLIEALAVLALAGLILVAMATGARLLLGNWARAAEQANRIEEIATGLAVARRDLAGAERRRWTAGEEGGLLFRGNESGLTIPVSHDGMAPGRGASIVSLEIRPNGRETALIRSAGRLQPDARALPSGPLANPVTLLSGALALRFAYRAETGGWQSAWTDPNGMPAAVRLEVRDPATGTAAIPPLIVTLRVDAEPACAPQSTAPCSRRAEAVETEPALSVPAGPGGARPGPGE